MVQSSESQGRQRKRSLRCAERTQAGYQLRSFETGGQANRRLQSGMKSVATRIGSEYGEQFRVDVAKGRLR